MKIGLLRRLFSEWRIQVLLARMKSSADQHATRIAEVHQQIADNEHIVMNAIRITYGRDSVTHATTSDNQATDNQENTGHVCVVCLSDVPANHWIECECHHRICFECTEKICATAFDQCRQVTCPSITDCGASIADTELNKIKSGRLLTNERQHRHTIDIVLNLMSDYTPDAAMLRMRYLRHDRSYAAFECPLCGFGPIEHAHCADLLEWHLREGNNNSCPQCGQLTTRSDNLRRWSGK